MTSWSTLSKYNAQLRYVTEDDYIKGNYLVVIGYSICTTRDFRKCDNICGVPSSSGLYEGKKAVARLGFVTGIIANPMNKKITWFADHTFNCIRSVQRTTNITNIVTGKCDDSSVKDGPIAEAKIGYPINLVKRLAVEMTIYFFDNKEESLRCLVRSNSAWYVRTIFKLNRNVNAFTFDPHGEYVYFNSYSDIVRVSTEWKSSFENIISGIGHNDGTLYRAKLDVARYSLFLDNSTFLFADYKNHVVRLVDLIASSISSICIPQTKHFKDLNGSISTCQIRFPRQLFKSRNSSAILILGDASVYELKFSGRLFVIFFKNFGRWSKSRSFMNFCF